MSQGNSNSHLDMIFDDLFFSLDKITSYGHSAIPSMITSSYEYIGQEDADEYFLPSFEFEKDSVITGFELYSLTTANSFRVSSSFYSFIY